jgi:hypothetical protein
MAILAKNGIAIGYKNSDAPFSLGNDVRAVFHHRAHRDHREGALVRVLGKKVWMRILIATNFLKKRAKSTFLVYNTLIRLFFKKKL